MSEQQFLTHGTAANAALEECMKKIDAGLARLLAGRYMGPITNSPAALSQCFVGLFRH